MYLRDHSDIWGFIQDGEYEPEEVELVKSLVKPKHVCMDIGANIGFYTILLSKISHKVYAFEPEPSNYDLLTDNLVLNKCYNVDASMDAISDENKATELFLCDSNHGMHRLYKSRWCGRSIPVRAVTIDDSWRGHERLDFVKIDVEGSESSVISGMRKTIEKHHPIMLIEFHPPTLVEAGSNPELLYLRIREMDYNISLAPSLTPIGYQELRHRTNDSMGGQNILCLPT